MSRVLQLYWGRVQVQEYIKKKLYRNEGANRTTHFACNLNCIEILVGAIKLIFCSSYNVYYFSSTVSDDEEVVTVDYEEGTASVIVIYFMVDIEPGWYIICAYLHLWYIYYNDLFYKCGTSTVYTLAWCSKTIMIVNCVLNPFYSK